MQSESQAATVELLPCPFCGSDTVQTIEFRWNPVCMMWAVECVRGCEMRGPVADTEAQAIERWNTRHRLRTAPAPGVELVEALRPFADIADTIDEVGRMYEDDDRINVVQAAGCQLAELDEDHFRRARTALASLQDSNGDASPASDSGLREALEIVRDIDVPRGAWDWIEGLASNVEGPHRRIETPRDAETIVFWHDERPSAVVLNLRDQFNRSVQLRLNIAALAKLAPPTASNGKGAESEDTALLNKLRDESWDLRCFDVPTGGGDADIGWRVVGHWQARPHERTIAEVFHDEPRDAIRAALKGALDAGENGDG